MLPFEGSRAFAVEISGVWLARSRTPMSSAAGTWQVLLGGSFKDYEDSAVQEALEAAYTRGDAAADVNVRGTVYEVSLQGDALQQRQKNDPTRTR